jgi:excisionase family DNA binding protein
MVRTVEAEAPRDKLLTVNEVADYLGVQPQTLYYWRHTRRGPRSLKVGGLVRWRQADVEAWLAHNAREPR